MSMITLIVLKRHFIFRKEVFILIDKKLQYSQKQLMILAGYYIADLSATSKEHPDNDTEVLTCLLSQNILVDMQQFIILYYLLLQYNYYPLLQYNANQNLTINASKYTDAYGIPGAWERMDTTKKHNLNMTILDNIINKKSQFDSLLQNAFCAVMDNKKAPEKESLISTDNLKQAEFIYRLLTPKDLSIRIKHILDLGWRTNGFIYTNAVNAKLTNWFKHYPMNIINHYYICLNPDPEIRLRLLVKDQDMDQANQIDPEICDKLTQHAFSSRITKTATVPIWCKFDAKEKRFKLDQSKYSPEQLALINQ